MISIHVNESLRKDFEEKDFFATVLNILNMYFKLADFFFIKKTYYLVRLYCGRAIFSGFWI